MNASTDIVGTTRDAASSATVAREQHVKQFERELSLVGHETSTTLASAATFLTSTIADIAAILAITPSILFFGPSQIDTAYSIAIPLTVLIGSQFASAAVSQRLTKFGWTTVSCSIRLLIALVFLLSPNLPFTSVTSLSICIALLWGTRLNDLPGDNPSVLWKTAAAAAPATSFLLLLLFYSTVQTNLIVSAISLYTVALVLTLTFRSKHASARNTTLKARPVAIREPASTITYEVFLSCLSGLMLVVPLLLCVTDQSLSLPSLRAEVSYCLWGWLAGSLAAVVVNKFEKIKIVHLHLVFTITLAALGFCKFSNPAFALLFITCMIAASIANFRAVSTPWKKAIAVCVLALASMLAYLHLTPLQCALAPIHVVRTLAAICFVPSIVALFTFARSRLTIYRMVAYVVPTLRGGRAHE